MIMTTRREECLALSEDILSDIELSRLNPVGIVRKTSRLARIMEDIDAMTWLYYEVAGYPTGNLDPPAWSAAVKSRRTYNASDGKLYADARSLGAIQAEIDAGKMQFSATADASVQISSANQNQYVHSPSGNSMERNLLRNNISNCQALLDKVLGSVHIYVTKTYNELRFGAAVESAFQSVRNTVDSKINSLIPKILPILTTALENAQTNNQIQWNNAAKSCRDIIKASADALRPPGESKNGIKMGEENYINRLVDWIQENINSGSKSELLKSELTHLGERLDAVNNGGHKGTHADVSKNDASRYIVSTYLLLGDILQISENTSSIDIPVKKEIVAKTK